MLRNAFSITMGERRSVIDQRALALFVSQWSGAAGFVATLAGRGTSPRIHVGRSRVDVFGELRVWGAQVPT